MQHDGYHAAKLSLELGGMPSNGVAASLSLLGEMAIRSGSAASYEAALRRIAVAELAAAYHRTNLAP